MADKLTKWQEYDKLRLDQALKEIESSKNLRFLFRQILELTRVDSFVPHPTLSSDFTMGQAHIHKELVSFLKARGLNLAHTLEIEEQNELSERLLNADPAVSDTDGGEPERTIRDRNDSYDD